MIRRAPGARVETDVTGRADTLSRRNSPRTIFGWDEQVRVEIEALKMGLAGPGGGDPGNLKVSLCKGRFRGIFDLAQHDFDETLGFNRP